MVNSAVVFLANFASRQVLVTNMAKNFSEGCLALLILLLLTPFGVPEFTDVTLNLLLVAVLVLLLLVAGFTRPAGDTSFTLPVGPHVGKLISGQKGLVVLPIKGISVEHIVHKLGENCGPPAVAP